MLQPRPKKSSHKLLRHISTPLDLSPWIQSNGGRNQFFFAKCDVENCKEAFSDGVHKAGWSALPKVLRIPPKGSKRVDVKSWQDMSSDSVTENAAEIAAFVSTITGYKKFLERSILATIQVGLTYVLAAGGVVTTFMYILPRFAVVYNNPRFWFTLSLGVYMLTQAGVVYNSIHRPPFSYRHPQSGQQVYIYPSARQQFVAEGLIMAVLQAGMGLLWVAFAEWIPNLKSASRKRVAFVLLALCFFITLSQIMNIFRVKYGFYPF